MVRRRTKRKVVKLKDENSSKIPVYLLVGFYVLMLVGISFLSPMITGSFSSVEIVEYSSEVPDYVEEKFVACGDGICSSGEDCTSDCSKKFGFPTVSRRMLFVIVILSLLFLIWELHKFQKRINLSEKLLYKLNKKFKKPKKRRKKGSVDHRFVTIVFFVIIIMMFGIFLFKPGITGLSSGYEIFTYDQDLGIETSMDLIYDFVLDNFVPMDSLKINGKFEGTGYSKIYIENKGIKYLVYDSSEVEVGNLITAFVVSNFSIDKNSFSNNSEINNSIINETIITENKLNNSKTNNSIINETINETLINESNSINNNSVINNSNNSSIIENNSSIVNETIIEDNNSKSIDGKIISINLEYGSDPLYDPNNNGITGLDGVVDLTVARSSFDWEVNESNLCTRWESYSLDNDDGTRVCYGSEECCNFMNMAPSRSTWDNEFYSNVGRFGAYINNEISAQVVYFDGFDVYSSSWSMLPVKFVEEQVTLFNEVCAETCTLSGFNSSSYRLFIEVSDGTLYLDNVTYRSRVGVDNVFVDFSIKDSKGKKFNSTVEIIEKKEKIKKFNNRIEKGKHNINVKFNDNNKIKEIKLNDVNVKKSVIEFVKVDYLDKKVDEYSFDSSAKFDVGGLDAPGEFDSVFAIDPSSVNFTSGLVTVTATSNTLFKCKDWDFAKQKCYGSWVKLMDVVPGENYTIEISPSDPGFGEINITKADHLDENKVFINDIYEEVKALDDIWSEPIYHNEYIRVKFEENLTSDRDITIYPRNNLSLDTTVEVYYFNSSDLIMTFPVLNETRYYKEYLTSMEGSHDTFDLRILNLDNDSSAYLEFDHITDPTCTDNDGDGFNVTVSGDCGFEDCNDNDANIFPPGDNLYINNHTTICNGFYNISDGGAKGVIIINGSDINLNCNGTTINGSRLNFDYGIWVANQTNVTVGNCTILNQQYGIYLQNNNFSFVTNNTIINNSQEGIYLEDSFNNTISWNFARNNSDNGIEVASGENNSVLYNTVIDHEDSGSYGIFITSDYNEVIDNNISYNGYNLYLSSAEFNIIKNNRIYESNTHDGVYIASNSHNNTFINNTIWNNTNNGIEVFSGDDNNFSDNKILHQINTGDAAIFIRTNYNTFDNNNVSHNYHNIIVSGGEFNKIRHNSVYNSYLFYGIQLSGNSHNNTLINNTVYNNTEEGIYVTSGQNNNLTRNIVIYHTIGSGVRGIWVASDYNTIYENNISYNDIGPLVQGEFNVFKNNRIFENGGDGVQMTSNAHNNTFINNTVWNNSENGIEVTDGQNNNFTDNTVVHHTSTNSYGFYVNDPYNTYDNNNVSFNYYNFYLTAADYTVLKNNRIYGATVEDGIFIHTADDGTFINNTIWNNTDNGIEVDSGDRNNISYNAIFYHTGTNDYGIYTERDNTTFDGNNISFNYNNVYFNSAFHNTFKNNLIYDSLTDNGIQLLNSDNNTFLNNTFKYNEKAGILIDDGGDNLIKENHFDNNTIVAINLSGSNTDINTIQNNTYVNNTLDFTSRTGRNIHFIDWNVNSFNFTNAEVDFNNSFGFLDFNYTNITQGNSNLTTAILILANNITVVSSDNPGFNISAHMVLNDIIADIPEVLRDGKSCDSGCVNISYSNNEFKFSVESFTTYSVGNLTCVDDDGDGFNASNTIDCGPVIDCDDENANVLPLTDDLYINNHTTICNGFYNISDGGAKGVIIINGSDINLNCNNSVINGTQTSGDYGIWLANQTNVTVANCTIINQEFGIYLSSANFSFVTNNTLENNSLNGINLTKSHNNTISWNLLRNNSRHGIEIGSGSNNTISDNIILNHTTTNGYGIQLEDDYNIIVNNNISYNYYNIYLKVGDYNIIKNNDIYEATGEDGIFIIQGSNNNTILNNIIWNNSDNGIEIHSESNNISNNTILYHQSTNGYGIRISNKLNIIDGNNVSYNYFNIWTVLASHNIIKNNYVYESSFDDGISLTSASNNNTILNNIVVNNTDDGIAVTSSSKNNSITNNTVINHKTTNAFGIYSGNDYNTIEENNVSFNYYNIYLNSAEFNLVKNNKVYESTAGEGIYLATNSHNNTLINNTVWNNSDNGIEVNSGENNTIVNNTVVYQTSTNGLGIYIIGDNNRIEGNNASFNFANIFTGSAEFTVIKDNLVYNALDDGITLNDNSHNNTIINNIIWNSSDNGIHVSASDYNNITNNTIVYQNNTDSYGIYLTSSDLNTIKENNVSNNYYNIYLSNSKFNDVKNNKVYSATEEGIYLTNSHNTTVENNTVWNNSDNGVEIPNGENNTVKDNTIVYHTSSGGMGIRLGDDKNIIDNNNISYNYHNLDIESAVLNTIKNNRIYEAEVDGIILFSVSDNNTFENNSIVRNKVSGFSSTSGHFNIIKQNLFDNNTVNAINLTKKTANHTIIQNNTYVNNTVDVWLDSSLNNHFVDWNVNSFNFTTTEVDFNKTAFGFLDFNYTNITQGNSNLTTAILILANNITVLSADNPGFNISAHLTLEGIGGTDPSVFRDNSSCKSGCKEISNNLTTKEFKFSVEAFTSYSTGNESFPTWKENSTNDTIINYGDNVTFFVNWSDDNGLSFYIFGWNDSGTWKNVSNGTLNGTNVLVNVSINVTSKNPNVTCWRMYVNDTSNQLNQTDEFCFDIQETVIASVTPTVIATPDPVYRSPSPSVLAKIKSERESEGGSDSGSGGGGSRVDGSRLTPQISSINVSQRGSFNNVSRIFDECGDGICGAGENKIDCPEDCSEKLSPIELRARQIWIILILIAFILVVRYVFGKKKKKRKRKLHRKLKRKINKEVKRKIKKKR